MPYLQHRAGLLPDGVWDGWAFQMRLSMGLRGFVLAWPALRSMVSADFASWMDGLAEDGAKEVALYAERWGEAGVSLASQAPED